jgi:ribonuclease P protein component
MNSRLPKNERLHSKKLIKELFDKGSSFFLYPFKVMVLEINFELPETNQVLFSVSKKKLKKAVDRNLIKRRMRESYRLNKQILREMNGGKKIIGLIYVSSEIVTFQVIENKIKKILTTIKEKPLSEKNNP